MSLRGWRGWGDGDLGHLQVDWSVSLSRAGILLPENATSLCSVWFLGGCVGFASGNCIYRVLGRYSPATSVVTHWEVCIEELVGILL